MGIGEVCLHVQGKAEITLKNALYISKSAVCLISISTLAILMHTSITFDLKGIIILDQSSGVLLASGPLIPGRQLYTLDLQDALAEHALSTQHPIKLDTWHWQLSHANYQLVATMARAGLLPGMSSALLPTQPKCDLCIMEKQMQSPVPKTREKGRRATEKLQIVWVDLAGPMSVQSCTGNNYITDLVDDFTNMAWSIPLKLKSDTFLALQAWQKEQKVKMGKKVCMYCTGHDGELDSTKMESWLLFMGTKHEYGAPYTSQHMGHIKRMHQTLQGKARMMRLAMKCLNNLWDEFYKMATHLHAKIPTKSLHSKTPYELWYNCPPNYSYMHEIGCRAFVLILNQHNPKLNGRAIECVLIGYSHNSRTYRCYDQKTQKIHKSYHVRFLERHDNCPTPMPPMNVEIEHSKELTSINQISQSVADFPFTMDDDNDDANDTPFAAPPILVKYNQPVAQPNEPICQEPQRSGQTWTPTAKANPDNPPVTRLERAVQESCEAGEQVKAVRTEWHAQQDVAQLHIPLDNNVVQGNIANDPSGLNLANLTSLEEIEHLLLTAKLLSNPAHLDLTNEPCTWKEAQLSADTKCWKNTYKDEIKLLKDMGVWELIPREDVPAGQKVRKGCPIFKIKNNELGQAVRFKVCLVFKGYKQVYGQDYTKTTSPTARMESWRILLHLAAANSWDATQIDVKTAFLYGLLPDDKVQFMEQPEGF